MPSRLWACSTTAAVALIFLLLSCARAPVTSTPLPTMAPATPKATEAPAVASAMPAGATVLQSVQADLDGDGAQEQISIYQAGDQLGVGIAPAADPNKGWHVDLPGKFSSVTTRDINADRLPEVLIQTCGPEADWYNLAVISWSKGQGHLLSPEGGPLGGQPVFRSHYYAPIVDDVDGNETGEILVAWDSDNPRFLDTLVYEWTGDAFIKSDGWLAPPRVVPTAAPSSSQG